MARNKLPVELEVMRLMGGASGAEVEIGWGLMLILFTLMLTLPMILLGSSKAVVAGRFLFAIGELLGAFYLLYGMRRLHKTINSSAPSQREIQLDAPRAFPQQEQPALPPQSVSITEGTTELIDEPQQISSSAKQAKTTDSME